MTIETIIVAAAVLAIFAAVMFFAFRQQQRNHRQIMAAYEAGDRKVVRKQIISGAVVLIGFVAIIGYEEGIEGAITVVAVMAILLALGFFALCVVMWRRQLKLDDPSSGPIHRYDNRFLFGGVLLAITAFVGGTATLVTYHGPTTIIIYFVVVPPAAGLILCLQWLFRRLRCGAKR
ncbi:MAG: hypothetical protein HN478_09280 [Rhodospirillaceae bacterium]|nr:hypothetical protein [Rhodospirillaceae bacterium]MBT4487749.1 hypothetical protein [Rhodospirillaceae bacterium]MBT5191013.1 hypothetical protein [Rhodospirillaceae bacterium]MBT5894504.1 hypothetical protein [Rhodospirillaceae bacterium]MBT6429851.1 hypothetical protein [Rhodospirillaceae bacterium]